MKKGTTRIYRWTEVWEQVELNLVEYEFITEVYLPETPQKDDIIFINEGHRPIEYKVYHRVVTPHEVKVIVKRA